METIHLFIDNTRFYRNQWILAEDRMFLCNIQPAMDVSYANEHIRVTWPDKN